MRPWRLVDLPGRACGPTGVLRTVVTSVDARRRGAYSARLGGIMYPRALRTHGTATTGAAGDAAAASGPDAHGPLSIAQIPVQHLPLGSHAPPKPAVSGGGLRSPVGGVSRGEWLAYRHWLPPPGAHRLQGCDPQQGAGGRAGDRPAPQVCVMICNGLKSSMDGLKVQRLLACCQARRLEFLAFDFRGHGGSSGRFLQHGPGDWLRDAAELLRRVVVARRVVLVGSSLGGWLALRLLQDQLLAARRSTPPGPGPTQVDAPSCRQRPAGATGHAGQHRGGHWPPAEAVSGCHEPRAVCGVLLVAPAVDHSEHRWAALQRWQHEGLLEAGRGEAVTTLEAGERVGCSHPPERVLDTCSDSECFTVSMESPYAGAMQGGDRLGVAYFAQGRQQLLLRPDARHRPMRPGEAFNSQEGEAEGEGGSGADLPGVKAESCSLEDGRRVRQGGAELAATGAAPELGTPITILHGTRDEVVPLDLSRRLARALEQGVLWGGAGHAGAGGKGGGSGRPAPGPVRLVAVEGGDHQLSGAAELRLLERELEELVGAGGGPENL